MTIEFTCDNCRSPFAVDAQLAGRAARCRKCGRRMTIPSHSAARRPLIAVPAGGGREGADDDSPDEANSSIARGRPIGWLDAVNSQIAMKPITMVAAPAVRPKKERVEKSVTSYKAVLPKAPKKQRGVASRPASAVKLGYQKGVKTYRGIFQKFGRLAKWLNETAYGFSLLFMIMAIAGAIMNRHSWTVLGVSAIVLLNVVRLVAGLANVVAIPFRESPLNGILFLIPPFTFFYLWRNWDRWQKPITRAATPVITIAVVIAAYAYFPWLNGGEKREGSWTEKLKGAAGTLQQDVESSISQAREKAEQAKEALPEQVKKLKLDELQNKASQTFDELKTRIETAVEGESSLATEATDSDKKPTADSPSKQVRDP